MQAELLHHYYEKANQQTAMKWQQMICLPDPVKLFK